ncbi:UvrB/UvrC motif-containing protein [Solibacillus sp. FSL H8-0538]|uniref:UvrB/UvrC motif-containing protein n=1 Tax=Solibacillus sp. FSL H8-0538 TaxID=2921400 RepID=UPI0030F4ECF3
MICEHCKQRHANVTVTQVQSGQKFERHYCEVCAAQFHPFQFEVKEEPVSLQQLVSNWLNVPFPKNVQEEKQNPDKKLLSCPSCGFTYRHFLNKGRFGCAQCYETFRDQLPNVLKRLQAGTKHIGKADGEQLHIGQWLQQIAAIREQMKQAIAEEQFEEAAKMRDEIRMLESRVHAGGVDFK